MDTASRLIVLYGFWCGLMFAAGVAAVFAYALVDMFKRSRRSLAEDAEVAFLDRWFGEPDEETAELLRAFPRQVGGWRR